MGHHLYHGYVVSHNQRLMWDSYGSWQLRLDGFDLLGSSGWWRWNPTECCSWQGRARRIGQSCGMLWDVMPSKGASLATNSLGCSKPISCILCSFHVARYSWRMHVAGKYSWCKASCMGWNWNGYCCSGCAGSSDPVLVSRFFPFKSGSSSLLFWFFQSSSRKGRRQGPLAQGIQNLEPLKFTLTLGSGTTSLVVSGLLGYLCISILNRRCIPRTLAQIFSNDPAVLDLFETCRLPFAAFVVRVSEANF